MVGKVCSMDAHAPRQTAFVSTPSTAGNPPKVIETADSRPGPRSLPPGRARLPVAAEVHLPVLLRLHQARHGAVPAHVCKSAQGFLLALAFGHGVLAAPVGSGCGPFATKST